MKMKRKYITAHDENTSTSRFEGRVNKRLHVSSGIEADDMEMESAPSTSRGVKDPLSCGLSASGLFKFQEFDFMAINAMAHFYLALRPVKATRCSDLNVTLKYD